MTITLKLLSQTKMKETETEKERRERLKRERGLERKYNQNLEKNKGWMYNIDSMDGNQDGWLKADILYQQFPGLKKELPGITTKYEDGSIFFKSSQMAQFITDEYNK